MQILKIQQVQIYIMHVFYQIKLYMNLDLTYFRLSLNLTLTAQTGGYYY